MKINPFRFRHQGASQTLVLNTMIDLPEQGCFLIAGDSGVGKSTFLQLLKGFYPEFLKGDLSGELSPIENSHYLFQNPFTQIIHPKAISEFLFSMENKGFTRNKMQGQLTWLSAFKLLNIQNKETRILSHGECQRLLLASLIAGEPRWLFLDEPTAFLDKSMRQYVYDQMSVIKKQMGILLIDHHLEEVSPVIDGYFVLEEYLNKNGESEVEISFSLGNDLSKLAQGKDIQDLDLPLMKKSWGEQKLVVHQLAFGYERTSKLFSDLSFTLNAGEVLTLIGPSGSGKSTLLKLILYELKHQQGNVDWYLNHELIPAKKVFDIAALLFQNSESHFLFDTVSEELEQFYEAGKKKEVDQLLEIFKLKPYMHQSPYLLSEGQKRRLSFIITVLLDRPFLLLDEPSFGLDLEQVKLLQMFIKKLQQQGTAILIISHDPSFYQEISDRVISLEQMDEK